MKQLFIVAATVIFFLSSCSPKVGLKNTWELDEYLGSPLDTEVFSNTIPEFTFNPDEGTFGGNNGCNQVNGKISVDGNKIKMEVLLGTRMFCKGVPEQEIEAKIAEVNNYDIIGKKLYLNKGNLNLFVFKLVNIK